MIKAVFFDLNGVLITSEFLSDRFEKEYGITSAEFVDALKMVMAIVRRPDAPSIYSQFQPYFASWNLNITEEAFLNFWFSGESINTEALEYVKELRAKNVSVFVVSNNFRERTQYYRDNFGEIFSNVRKAYFSWETGYVKPSGEALALVLAENNLKPEEVIYFDDSFKNVEVARGLGIDGKEWRGLDLAKQYLSSHLQ